MQNQDNQNTDTGDKIADALYEQYLLGFEKGLEHSLMALNHFLDKKLTLNGMEHITRKELNTFMETYIQEQKKQK